MKKMFLWLGVIGAAGLMASLMWAGANKNLVTPVPPVVVPDVAPTTPVAGGTVDTDTAVAPNSVPGGKVVLPPAKPASATTPGGSLQQELNKVAQKAFGQFQQNELVELFAALDGSLKSSLASKDFDSSIDKLRDAIAALMTTLGRNLSLCKNLNQKLTAALKTAVSDFDILTRSGKLSKVTGESYIAQIINSGISGLQTGLAKATITDNCTANTKNAVASYNSNGGAVSAAPAATAPVTPPTTVTPPAIVAPKAS